MRTVVLSILVFSIIFSTTFVYAQNNSDIVVEHNELNNETSITDNTSPISIEEAIKFSGIINEQFDKLKGYWNGEYPDYYGGAYIEGLTFSILVTCDPQIVAKEIWRVTGNNDIKFVHVNNSYLYLERVRDAIQHSIQQKMINRSSTKDIYSGFGIDEKSNKVILEVIVGEAEKAFSLQNNTLLSDKNVIQRTAKFILEDISSEVSGLINENNTNVVIKENPYTPTADVIAGTTATTSKTSSISVCGSVKDASNATVNGFALCGHVGNLGDIVKIGSTNVGKIQSKAYYSTLDMSFVNMADYPSSGYVRTKKVGTSTATINSYGSVGVVGTTYTLYGTTSTTTRTGTVDSTSFSFTMDGISFGDFIRMKMVVQVGDSGGPLVAPNGTSTTEKIVIGFCSGGDSTYSNFTKFTNFRTAFNFTLF